MSNHSPLTGWEIVREAEALHPEWTLAEHVAHLHDHYGFNIDPIWVARWLRNIAADKSQPDPSHDRGEIPSPPPPQPGRF